MRYPFVDDRPLTIHLSAHLFAEMVTHCRRKLQGAYLPGEGQAPKAFGLVGGAIERDVVRVGAIIPLAKNVREVGDRKELMDRVMDRHAIISETPLAQRGWVADPGELDSALQALRAQGLRLIGNYHMHRVAWEHDRQRDTPTELDTVLGQDSRLLMFIIAMVNPMAPVIRAFFEGRQALELPIQIG